MLTDSERILGQLEGSSQSSRGIGRPPRVLIIGGGFSGTVMAVQLARREIPSIVIDPAERPARGLAYSTRSPHHFLNVRSSNMSALRHKPDDFESYVASRIGETDPFASRRDYGDYLEQTLAPFIFDGLVTRVQGRAVQAHPENNAWRVRLGNDQTLSAETLVLAIGNAPPAPLAGTRPIDKSDLIDLFWNPGANSRLEIAAAGNEPVLIVGTGLTMIDTLLSLDAAGHRGPVTAVSRHGLLPLAHADTGLAVLPAPALDDVPKSLSNLLRWLRDRAASESDWRLAIDSLRPLTQSVWRRMERETRKRFLRHGRAYWDIHRHRVAPAVHARVIELRSQGRFRIVAGKVINSERRDNRYSVRIEPRRGDQPIEIEAGLVINCTGPLSSLREHPDPLIVQMLSDRLIRPDELDLGAEIDANDRLVGLTNAYAIGPLARGRYWEITAVPDLRVKADEIAGTIKSELGTVDLEQAYRHADQSSGV